MKIAVLTNSVSTRSESRIGVELAKHLSKLGHKVHLYVHTLLSQTHDVKKLQTSKVNVTLIESPNAPLIGKYLASFKLAGILKRDNHDIIYHPKSIFYHHHAFTTSTFPLSQLYFLGFRLRLRLYLKLANIGQFISFATFHYLIIMPFRIFIKKEPILLPEINTLLWNLKNLKNTLRSGK